jgi:16S rRNA (guanine966-N2)-methyltransferase
MGDRERTAIFNSIRDYLPDATVLDAFAGSGALGLEALSLGAKSVVFIEKDRSAAQTISKNIKTLGVGDETKLHAAPVAKIAETLADASFDIIFADPPYDAPQLAAITELTKKLKTGGLLVLSLPKNLPAPTFENLKIISDKTYAAAGIRIYQKHVKI